MEGEVSKSAGHFSVFYGQTPANLAARYQLATSTWRPAPRKWRKKKQTRERPQRPNQVQSNPVDNNSTTSNPSSTSNQSSTFYSTNAASNANSSKWINVDRRPFANARKKNDFNLTRRRIANDQNRGGNDPIQASRNQHGPRTRRNIIVGTKNSDSVIGGGERVLDIYVGGCGKECTTENITSYCDEHGISIKKCELLQSSSEWNRSFKVSATANDRDKLLLGEFWPQGIFVRRFFKARNRASD